MKTKHHTKHWLRHLIVTAILSFSLNGVAIAAPSVASISSLKGNAENGKNLYFTCALCHTPEGWGTEDGEYPQLSGQHSNVIIKQLFDIKMRNRAVPNMIPFADEIFSKGEQNVADVVSYIASLPIAPINSEGKGDKLELGKKLYTQKCESCHGAKAEGSNEKSYPLLQGQHYPYLLRQMKWIKNEKRKNGNELMQQSISALSDADLQAVADYISRIKLNKDNVAETADWQNPDFHDGFISVPDSLDDKEAENNSESKPSNKPKDSQQ